MYFCVLFMRVFTVLSYNVPGTLLSVSNRIYIVYVSESESKNAGRLSANVASFLYVNASS